MASATGTAVLNFGSAPGTNYVTTVVTGQAAIGTSSHVEAFLMADTTATHNEVEHLLAGIKLTCGGIVAATGFTIYAFTDQRLTGTFNVHWVWAD